MNLEIIKLLDHSETYMQNNLNAAMNNMSLLTLHAFEFRTQIEDKKKDIEVKEKIFRNIEGHAAIIKGKSERMAKRLQTATARFGSPRRRMTNK